MLTEHQKKDLTAKENTIFGRLSWPMLMMRGLWIEREVLTISLGYKHSHTILVLGPNDSL